MAYSIIKPAIAVAAAFSISGCIYYGNPGDYDPYYDGYYEPYPATGFAYSYFGWYDDCYYPGIGSYVYNRYGHRQRWTSRQRKFWQNRRDRHRAKNRTQNPPRENWDGFTRGEDGIYRDQREDVVRNRRGERRGEEYDRRVRNRSIDGADAENSGERRNRSGARNRNSPAVTGATSQPSSQPSAQTRPRPAARSTASSAPKPARVQTRTPPPRRAEPRPAPRPARQAPRVKPSKHDD